MGQPAPPRYDTKMAGCVLRIFGTAFQVDAFLAGSTLAACKVWHCGDRALPRRPAAPNSGFNAAVSEADDLPTQVSEALLFLRRHRVDLIRLSTLAKVDELVLDFGTSKRESAAQFERIPSDLVRAAAELRMSFELSLYSTSDE
jgi:hypothetical protein